MGEPLPPGGSTEQPPAIDKEFEWYKKEHETLSKHFEEAAKSGALNFSYVAIVSAALLTFGSSRLQSEVVLLLTVLLIVIWLLFIFRPFAKYVESIGYRLRKIEEDVKRIYGISSEGHFTFWFKHVKSTERRAPRLLLPVSVAAAFFYCY